MKLGIRARLLLASLAAIAAVALVGGGLVSHAFERLLIKREQQSLLARANLAAFLALKVSGEPTAATWTKLVRDVSARSGLQVAVLTPGGELLAASRGPAPKAPDAPNLAPEAIGDGEAFAVVEGEHGRFLLAAVPVGDPPLAVVRVAEPLDAVDQDLAALHQLIAVVSILAALLALALSSLATRWLSQTVSNLSNAARRMAAGEAGVRARDATGADLGELGHAVDQLSESLLAALRELRTERDLFRGGLEAMQEGVLVLDADGRIEHVNSALREMLLLDSNVQGRLPLEVIRNSELQELLRRAREQPGPASAEVETAGLKPRRLLVRAASLPGETRGLLAAFVDVTNIRRLETLRRDFVANVSHELRTPVASIRSAAETLRSASQTDPAAASRFLDMIERNAERMHRLVNDLLELARIESRELRLALEPVELAAAVELAAGLLRDRIERKRLQLQIDAPRGLRVTADRRALEQILSNLLDNAIKYCPEGARITVRATRDGGRVRVGIEDNGPGIEARHLPRLFERFYRVDAGRSRELGGTGLGLSIVKHLAESMSGSVWVDSKVGQGSTFGFVLPVADA